MLGGYLGTETPYIYRRTKLTMPPKGYKPVYISHIGRHGSRYVTSGEEAEQLYRMLEDAASKGKLKSKGYKLKKQVKRFLKMTNDRYGLLTRRGIEEEKGIAHRMYLREPSVFGKEVRAVSTYVTRTKQSMEAFLQALATFTSKENFVVSSNGKIDPILRFFDLNTAYLGYKAKGRWRGALKTFEKRENVASPFLKQFFELDYLKHIEDPIGLSTTVYTLYANSFNMEVNLGLGQYFNNKTLAYFWENENLKNFLEKGPSFVGEYLPTQIAFALLRSWLKETDEALRSKSVSADLRFAHAETVIPFVSLLGLKGASTQTDCLEQVSKIWKDTYLSPMAVNLQWIFYEGGKGQPILVKLLYNEKEYPMPLMSQTAPYYEWSVVRKFYEDLLNSLPIPHEENVVLQVKDFKAK